MVNAHGVVSCNWAVEEGEMFVGLIVFGQIFFDDPIVIKVSEEFFFFRDKIWITAYWLGFMFGHFYAPFYTKKDPYMLKGLERRYHLLFNLKLLSRAYPGESSGHKEVSFFPLLVQ